MTADAPRSTNFQMPARARANTGALGPNRYRAIPSHAHPEFPAMTASLAWEECLRPPASPRPSPQRHQRAGLVSSERAAARMGLDGTAKKTARLDHNGWPPTTVARADQPANTPGASREKKSNGWRCKDVEGIESGRSSCSWGAWPRVRAALPTKPPVRS